MIPLLPSSDPAGQPLVYKLGSLIICHTCASVLRVKPEHGAVIYDPALCDSCDDHLHYHIVEESFPDTERE